ncbi:MAG: hypothetical protein HC936_18775 [Leptolyngbyaceae cyanobacterium SU_3_3]|nr:hypothetical protein [Leptolyngbyaceae cyanobacterium SU_3_3]NJR50998.1 hypothetical protein [Leptolyngbyaceae cyanobacterium CSU_1_3]
MNHARVEQSIVKGLRERSSVCFLTHRAVAVQIPEVHLATGDHDFFELPARVVANSIVNTFL